MYNLVFIFFINQVSAIEQNGIIEVDPDTKEMLKALVSFVTIFFEVNLLYFLPTSPCVKLGF